MIKTTAMILEEINEYASPKTYTLAPVSNAGELGELLVQDLRIDEDVLRRLDLRSITELSEKYGCTNIRKLCTLLRRMQNE